MGQRGGELASETAALESAFAVAGGADELAAVVGGNATGAGPDVSGPVVGRGGEGAVGESWKVKAALVEDGVADVGLNGGPNGKVAVIDEGQEETVLAAAVGGGGARGKGKGGEEGEEQIERHVVEETVNDASAVNRKEDNDALLVLLYFLFKGHVVLENRNNAFKPAGS